jgi:hypothetical protein
VFYSGTVAEFEDATDATGPLDAPQAVVRIIPRMPTTSSEAPWREIENESREAIYGSPCAGQLVAGVVLNNAAGY